MSLQPGRLGTAFQSISSILPAFTAFSCGGRYPQATERRSVRPPGKPIVNDSQTQKVNLSEKLQQFTERWSPRIVGELNGQHVKLVKVEGEFVWHHHEREDELFLVLRGRLAIHLRERVIELDEGEFFIVPRGVEHKPVAEGEAHVLLLEPSSTLNTGNVRGDRTVDEPRRL
jgi:mannose-6-phosphate isomerase-like protein (cupin superfamily)